MVRLARAALTFLLLSCAQTEDPLTQLMLVADTDIPGIDTVQFRVEAVDKSRTEMATVARLGDAAAFVGVVRDKGRLGPLTVVAIGFEKNVQRVQRVQRVSFVTDQTRVVKLHLLASCVNKNCAASETCAETGCVPIDVPPENLEAWTGTAPEIAGNEPLDASVPHDASVIGRDAARDASGPGIDDARVGLTDASDGAVVPGPTDAGSSLQLMQCDGGTYDLSRDPYHCGLSCSTARQCDDGLYANTIKACVSGACDTCIGTLCDADELRCKRGYADCTSSLGCETNVTTSTSHCGMCGHPCAAGQTCVAGVCQ